METGIMNFSIVHTFLSFFRQTSGRLLAVAKPKNIKDEVISTEIAVNETKLNVQEEKFNEFYVSRITENDEYKVVLCRNRQEMEELLFSDLNHCIVASKSFITEILRERELEAKGIEPPLMDIADLNKNMLRVHRRANRYVFPIASDPDFQISVDYCFVEPEINENDARKKDRQTRASYSDILGCLETDPNIKRILILGEFGSGKNTLCVKMVNDIINGKFRFLEDKLNFKLFIACDLSKFRDWDKKKSLDDILLKFCHSYSTNNRLESTKKLIQQYSSNILCIFSGYENLTTSAKEKVDFVLKRENKELSVFGDSTIVLATCTDPAFTPCFLTYFQKFFVLSRINRTNVDTLLQKLFEDDIEEKDIFVENMKKMYLSFLLEISPLVLIYSVYVYKQYGALDRNQFVIELVYLMKDNKKDSRSFQNHRERIVKLLGSAIDALPNMTAGRNYGGFKNSKATECYEYLTNKRQRMDGMVIGSLSAKGSTIFNHKSMMSSDYEHILNIYNQQLRVQASFNQNFHQIYSVEKQKTTAMDELIYYSEKLRKDGVIQNMELEPIQDTKSKFLTSLATYLARVEVLNQDYSFMLISSAVRDLKYHIEDFKDYIMALRVCRHLSEIPLAFFVMFYVFRSFENKPPSQKVFLRNVCRELMNCVRNQNMENQKLSQRVDKAMFQSTTSPTELKFSLR